MNGRGQLTSVDGVDAAVQIKREARETYPDSPDAAAAYVLEQVADLLASNAAPTGKPFPAAFWRGLGTELKR